MHQQGLLNIGQLEAFLRRYAPIFGLGFMLCMLSIALGIVSSVDTLWRHRPQQIEYAFITGGLLVLTLSVGQIAMFRGLRWGIWPIVATLLVPLLMVTSQLGATRYPILQAIALAAPLLGLLVLNSKRHREMRRRLAELRLKRAGVLAGGFDQQLDGDEAIDDLPSRSKPWLLVTLSVLAVLLPAAKLYLSIAERPPRAPIDVSVAPPKPATQLEILVPGTVQADTRKRIEAASGLPVEAVRQH